MRNEKKWKGRKRKEGKEEREKSFLLLKMLCSGGRKLRFAHKLRSMARLLAHCSEFKIGFLLSFRCSLSFSRSFFHSSILLCL